MNDLVKRAQDASWMLKYLADKCKHAGGCTQRNGAWGPLAEYECDCFVLANYQAIRRVLVDMAAEIERYEFPPAPPAPRPVMG